MLIHNRLKKIERGGGGGHSERSSALKLFRTLSTSIPVPFRFPVPLTKRNALTVDSKWTRSAATDHLEVLLTLNAGDVL